MDAGVAGLAAVDGLAGVAGLAEAPGDLPESARCRNSPEPPILTDSRVSASSPGRPSKSPVS
jgi:hypothetical protein